MSSPVRTRRSTSASPGAYRVLWGEPRGGLAGAKHIDAVEARLGVDACVVPLIDQTPVVELPPEVLGHLVPAMNGFVARDQALAGIVGADELGQVLLVEQRQLQRLGLD